MIEIRTYDGEPAELAAFCTGVWRDRYRDKMTVAFWDGPFLEWELFSDELGARDFLVAAYDGGRLVGALPSKPVRYHWRGRPIAGSIGSFFTVDPAYEKQAVSLKLVLEQRRRHRERQAPLFGGYLIHGDPTAIGPKFWLRLPNMSIVGTVGLWIRMLDYRVMSEFVFGPWERRGIRVLGWIQPRPKPARPGSGIRAYRASDLADCLRLINESSQKAEFGILWDETTLARQLSYKDIPRTVVMEEGSRVAGFVNYRRQIIQGRRENLAGVIDLLAMGDLSLVKRRRLMLAALHQMASEGCHSALRATTDPGFLLPATGFLHGHPAHDFVIQSMIPDAPTIKARHIDALWR